MYTRSWLLGAMLILLDGGNMGPSHMPMMQCYQKTLVPHLEMQIYDCHLWLYGVISPPKFIVWILTSSSKYSTSMSFTALFKILLSSFRFYIMLEEVFSLIFPFFELNVCVWHSSLDISTRFVRITVKPFMHFGFDAVN